MTLVIDDYKYDSEKYLPGLPWISDQAKCTNRLSTTRDELTKTTTDGMFKQEVNCSFNN